MPDHRPITDTWRTAFRRPPRRSPGGPRRLVAAVALTVVSVGSVSPGIAAAQVEPDPSTTDVAPTTTPVAPSTTVIVTSTAVVTTFVPSTSATTQAPQVTTPPTTSVRPVVVAQAPSTSSSTSTSTSSAPGTTAALLVDGQETVATEAVAESDGLSSSTKLQLIVAALIAIAIVIAALTVLYWRKTRPYEWEEWDEEIDDAAEAPSVGSDGGASRATVRDDVAALAGGTSRPRAPGGETSGRGGPAAPKRPAPDAPAVPSLIDPDLRARLGSTTPPSGTPDQGDPSADQPARWGEERTQPEPDTDG